MSKHTIKRRDFLKTSAVVVAPALLGAATPPLAAAAANSARALKVVCVGAHPDDPESGCGGTLARYADLDHAVTVVYLTRGERGIRDRNLEEAARIRTAESDRACQIMGAKPVFFGQIDGATEFTRPEVEAMTKLLAAENPDAVYTHWPIDTHMDHQVASLLTVRACMGLGRPVHLYFFEVDAGSQTQGFLPNTYVDITAVLEKKKSALFAHVSQDGQGIWREHHEIMASWRGRETGTHAAEAFVHLNRDTQISPLPGV